MMFKIVMIFVVTILAVKTVQDIESTKVRVQYLQDTNDGLVRLYKDEATERRKLLEELGK